MPLPHPPDSDLIYDWNREGGAVFPARGAVEIDDETLRDGLQSPSVEEPLDRAEAPHPPPHGGARASTRPTSACPAPGPHVVETVTRLGAGDRRGKMKIRPNCAARTVDVGHPADHRDLAEGRHPDRGRTASSARRRSASTPRTGTSTACCGCPRTPSRSPSRDGLPVMYVTEDTTRSHPDHIRRLFTTAIGRGRRARLRLRHRRPRDAGRRPQPRPVRRATWPAISSRTSRSTGTATTTAASA